MPPKSPYILVHFRACMCLALPVRPVVLDSLVSLDKVYRSAGRLPVCSQLLPLLLPLLLQLSGYYNWLLKYGYYNVVTENVDYIKLSLFQN